MVLNIKFLFDIRTVHRKLCKGQHTLDASDARETIRAQFF